MRWGKAVLIFQAVVTLILGIIFFSKVLTMNDQAADQATDQAKANINNDPTGLPMGIDLSAIKHRFSTAAYTLLFISLIELIIITRLLT